MGDTPSPNRPAPAAKGTLDKTPLIHLLLYALQTGLTGTLELWVPDERRAGVLFLSGQPAKIYTSSPVHYLGATLHDLGYLSEEDLAKSLEDLARAKAAAPALHGQLLLAARTIDEPMLRAGLNVQLKHKLRHVAGFPAETSYAYYELFDGLRGWGPDVSEGYDPIPMIWGLLCENPPLRHVGAALANVASLPIRLARNASPLRLGLSPTPLAIVETLRERPVRVSDVIARSGLPVGEARLLVYLLLVTRQVDMLRKDEEPVADRPATPASPLTKGAPVTDDRPATRASPSLGGHEAARRATPSRSLPATPASSGPLSSPPATTPASGLSPEFAQRSEEIIQRAAIIDRSDYFAMLGMPRDATREEIQAGFISLAKIWHPDRLPPELAPVRDACSRVFARLSEAHATLVDAQKRANYTLLLADGSGTPETQAQVARVIDAATAFQKAEVCLRRADYAQAETLCRAAVDADTTQPDYLAMLSWLLSLKPENQSAERTLECVVMLSRAIKMNPRCERAYFWRGMLLRRLGKADAAVRDFKEAVGLNPRNIDAAREVRLYRMRGGHFSTNPPLAKSESDSPPKGSSPSPPKPDDGKPRLFDRLFKKP